MKFSEYLIENNEQKSPLLIKIEQWADEFGLDDDTTCDGIVDAVNKANPPDPSAQAYVFNNMYPLWALELRNVKQPLLNQILTNRTTVEDGLKNDWDRFVKYHFKGNQILINKWITYGDNMRQE